jgi:glycosyltransferase involved in cell wall biosynthesis
MENLRNYFEHILNFENSSLVAVDRCHNLFLIGALLSKKPESVLELGIGTGYITLSVIHALRYNQKGRLTCVDDWSEWGGAEPDGIDAYRSAGAEIVAPVSEREFVINCPSDSYDFLISDADTFLSGLWVDEHVRITNNNGFMFFHNTNRKAEYRNLQLIAERIKELGLFYYHFTESSRADEHCGRDWLFVINRNTKGAQRDQKITGAGEGLHTPGTESGPNMASVQYRPAEELLYLGLVIGKNYGWGVCSKYLIRELSNKARIHVLNEADGSATNRGLNGKLFQALTSVDFFGIYKDARGRENYGYTFFENELTVNSVENAKKYNLVLGGSSWCRDRMLERGINNCGVLIQGIDPEYFYPITEEKGHDNFVVFSGGKFELRKGQDLVLRAMKILQEKYSDIVLVNCWYNIWPQSMQLMRYSRHIDFEYKEGCSWTEIMNHICDVNGLDPARIKTYGLVSNEAQREIYKTTDIGVFPNRCEGGTNLVLMEYMACAKPVIVSFTSGHKDIVNGENALLLNDLYNFNLVDVENKLIGRWQEPSLDQLVANIEYAYHHREQIREIGKRAGEDLKDYTWECSARNLLDILGV